MCLLLASGMGQGEITRQSDGFEDFVESLTRVSISLARQIAADGEGATKLVEVVVRGAATEAGAHRIAKTIAKSPLVKTALFGCDPNWGRLLMAAGRAGIPFDPAQLDVYIGPFQVFSGGGGQDFDRDAANQYLKSAEVQIVLDLNMGDEVSTVWTCDYSYDYVRINAEYHT